MAYFYASFHSTGSPPFIFDELFKELLPPVKTIDTLTIYHANCFVKCFSVPQAVKDILIRDNHSDSWMIVIGTPLFHDQSIPGLQDFLRNFLADPSATLRNDIDGHFIIFAYNAMQCEILVASDINTTIPAYYHQSLNGVLFCSSELALAKHINAQINQAGFADTIYFGKTWDSQTRFSDIHKMQPCEIYRIGKNRRLIRQIYWTPSDESLWSGGLDETVERWGYLLQNSIQNFLNNSKYDTLFVDCSAGEDSRLLLAQCHALRHKYCAYVEGFPADRDVEFARSTSCQLGFPLRYVPLSILPPEIIRSSAIKICVAADAYDHLFSSCQRFLNTYHESVTHQANIRFTGVPGGEAFRGSYYLRGKVLRPAAHYLIDYKHFAKYKYLIDFIPQLLFHSDEEFLTSTYLRIYNCVREVEEFPAGIVIDHLIRRYQTNLWGTKVKEPIYLPFATNALTRSIYSINPKYKRGGRLTKALTEKLYPQIAYLKTQNGVPTIRKTWKNIHLFLPEYVATAHRISNGYIRRKLHKQQKAENLQKYLRYDYNMPVVAEIFTGSGYEDWFKSPENMLTGKLYNSENLEKILNNARRGYCENFNIISRIIAQECALRWVYS